MQGLPVRSCSLLGDRVCDVPLLRNRQNVVDAPVQDQARREEEHHATENERHKHHDFRLYRIGRRWVELHLNEHGCHHD